MKYAQARADFERLERIAELSDQVDLDSERQALMQNPTKKKASSMYCSGIMLWFKEHGRTHRGHCSSVDPEGLAPIYPLFRGRTAPCDAHRGGSVDV